MIQSTYRKAKVFFFVSLGLVAALGLTLLFERAAAETNTRQNDGTIESRGDIRRAFATVLAVLQSPRCQNCHIPGDAPFQGDLGKIHAMNVKRGEDGRGEPDLRCTYCHQSNNESMPHTPPGAVDWRLPPPSTPMVFINLSANELCSNLKNPSKNGGKMSAQLKDHVSKDRLVLWGWNPGPGRTKPPVSHKEFVDAFSKWVTAGMPCPENH
jgi:hypothetical protein